MHYKCTDSFVINCWVDLFFLCYSLSPLSIWVKFAICLFSKPERMWRKKYLIFIGWWTPCVQWTSREIQILLLNLHRQNRTRTDIYKICQEERRKRTANNKIHLIARKGQSQNFQQHNFILSCLDIYVYIYIIYIYLFVVYRHSKVWGQ